MLNSILENIKLERAKFSRDVEYLKEMAVDDILDEYLENTEKEVLNDFESSDMLIEANNYLESMSDNDEESSNNEIERIMEATSDMTFDEMIDVDSYVEKI